MNAKELWKEARRAARRELPRIEADEWLLGNYTQLVACNRRRNMMLDSEVDYAVEDLIAGRTDSPWL